MFNANISLNPKPFANKSGSGAHINISTLDMRNETNKHSNNKENNLL